MGPNWEKVSAIQATSLSRSSRAVELCRARGRVSVEQEGVLWLPFCEREERRGFVRATSDGRSNTFGVPKLYA